MPTRTLIHAIIIINANTHKLKTGCRCRIPDIQKAKFKEKKRKGDNKNNPTTVTQDTERQGRWGLKNKNGL